MLIFFISGIGPDILMNIFEGCVIFLIWVAWVCLSFILSQSKSFQSEALLKMLPSCPSKKEFGQDIHK